jgi:hypothetical protein
MGDQVSNSAPENRAETWEKVIEGEEVIGSLCVYNQLC